MRPFEAFGCEVFSRAQWSYGYMDQGYFRYLKRKKGQVSEMIISAGKKKTVETEFRRTQPA